MESRIVLGETIRWKVCPEGISIEGIIGYFTGLKTPQDWEKALTDIAAGRIMEKQKAILNTTYKKDVTIEENRYRDVLDREARIYRENMTLIKKFYDDSVKQLWKEYHDKGGVWDWDKERGVFGMEPGRKLTA